MTKFLWENKVIVCDICRERPYKKVVEVNKGIWQGICAICEARIRGAKNEYNLLQNKEV